MEKKTSKLEHMLKLSDEILGNFESEEISFEKILLKCKKLARMRDDYYVMKWFTLELHGYDEKNLPLNIKQEEIGSFAHLSGRNIVVKNPVTQKEESSYWIPSVIELETEIQASVISLENLKLPSEFTPAITKHSHGKSMYLTEGSHEVVVEKYQDVLNAFQKKMKVLSDKIIQNKSLLSKIRNNVYTYVLTINLQLRFENITESVFQTTKENVDKKLSKICPEAMKKFIAAYERLKSNNPEEWSQALSSCRNILKDFADYVFPAQNTSFKLNNGEKLKVTEDKYKNRLLAFIDRVSSGNRGRLLKSRIGDLTARIHNLNDLLSQGTHEGLELIDVNICVIDTYLLIGSLLSVTNIPKTEI